MLRFLSRYRALEKAIGYTFRKKRHLEEALTHRSYRFENTGISSDNQRMEFLGDSLLGVLTAIYLYEKCRDSQEGVLTSFRSQVASGKALGVLARNVRLGDFMRIGRGEEKSGGRNRDSNLADAFEAVMGAAYVDGGFKAVQKIFKRVFVPFIDNLKGDVWADNPKGRLQEYSQRNWRKGPRYEVIRRDGPPHAAVFTVRVTAGDGNSGIGVGKNKQEAESRAAADLLRQVGICCGSDYSGG